MQSVSKLAVFLTKTQPRNSTSNGSKLVTGCYKEQFLLPLAPAPSPPCPQNMFNLDLTLQGPLFAHMFKKECIPVGCVPPAAVAVGGA